MRWSNTTPQERSEFARRREAAKTPEQRSEQARKARATQLVGHQSKTKADKAAYDRVYKSTPAGRARAKAWREANPDKYQKTVRACYMRSRYGLTVDEYDRLHVDQGGVCAICSRPETATHGGKVKRLAIDHCHTTGKVRGLLCFRCNSAVGNMGNDASRMRAAAEYIEAHHGEG